MTQSDTTIISEIKSLKPERRLETGGILMSSSSGLGYTAERRGRAARFYGEAGGKLAAIIPWAGFGSPDDWTSADFDTISAWIRRNIAAGDLTTLRISPEAFWAMAQAVADLAGSVVEICPWFAQSEPSDLGREPSEIIISAIHAVAEPLFYSLEQDGEGVVYQRSREVMAAAVRGLTDHDRLERAALLMGIVEHLSSDDRKDFEQAVNDLAAARS
jgi:hypothetical protein